MVLVGPSGCGKTTALRMVAGLEEISEGVLQIGDRVVNHVPSRDRDIAMVFQSYALYPHLSVYENIAFGLRLRKMPKAEIDERVQKAAKLLGLEEYLEAQAARALRRPAAARRDGPRDRARAGGVPDGRAALEPRREAARADARRDREAAGRSRRDDDLRHARPGRGDDDGRPRRRHAQGRAPAGRRPADALRPAGQPVRRRLHRQPGDEHARRDDRRLERRPARDDRRPDDLARRRDARRSGPALRGYVGKQRDHRHPPRGSRGRGARDRRARRPTGCTGGSSCARRSARRSWRTSRSRPRTPRRTRCASWRRTQARPTRRHRSASRRTRRSSSAASARARASQHGDEIEAVVDTRALHFFDPGTGNGIYDSPKGALDEARSGSQRSRSSSSSLLPPGAAARARHRRAQASQAHNTTVVNKAVSGSVTFDGIWTGSEATAFGEVIKAFNKVYPNVKVNYKPARQQPHDRALDGDHRRPSARHGRHRAAGLRASSSSRRST